ncbi:MAG: 50S ribosomal protein L29 [Candidatus Diapherotrites archaeon CG08_land_8_20_14_0_20_34_12]|nr:MAG: 50S ribosomal protein L29 [Candidatus Diapherotrites archaeon CG08_land_8_20_14_0_20_34_12]
MKASELRTMNALELEAKLRILKIELAKERAVIASGTRPEKPTKIRNTRKDIARILTILNQKKLAGKIAEIIEPVKEEHKEVKEKTQAHKEHKVHKLHKYEKVSAKKQKKEKKSASKQKKIVRKKTGVKK